MLKDENVNVQAVLSLIEDFKTNTYQSSTHNEINGFSSIADALVEIIKQNENGLINPENSLLKSILNSIPALISYIDNKLIYQFVNLTFLILIDVPNAKYFYF